MTWSRGVGSLALVALLAALGPAEAMTTSKPPAIQQGGTVVVGTFMQPGAVDPDVGGTPEFYRSFCEALYSVDPEGTTVPLIASGFPIYSKDHLTVTIPLRKGLTFNDGTPFNAQAAVATFERDITTPGSARLPILGPVTSVNASGPYSVQLHYSSPNTALSGGLTNERMQSPAQIAKLGSKFGTDPVCIGPFMFQSEVPGQTLTVVRSPYYYDKQDVHLDKLVFQYEPSDLGAVAALEAGDVQALDNVPADVLKSVKDNGFRVTGSLGLGTYYIGVNIGNANGTSAPTAMPNTPIATSAALRQAFEMAIDRKTLNKVVFRGLNIPGCTPVSPAAGVWFDPTIQCTPYDPAQAKKLVAQSGISNPTVDLMYQGTSVQYQTLAEFIQAEEQAVGINVTLDPVDPTVLSSRASAGQYQTYISSSTPVKADPDWMRTALPTPTWGFSSPQWKIDMTNGRMALSQQARQVVYSAALKVLISSRAVIYLNYILNRAAYTTRLTGVELYPDNQIRVEFAAYKAS
jgi:peptide/nickel transport system substrate-binding protein